MKFEMLFSGIGGQGVMRLGEILCDAAIKAGYLVTFSPFYGQEKRGGRTMCHIVMSDEMESPVISEANIMLIFDEKSLVEQEHLVAPDGTLIINSSMIDTEPTVKCKSIEKVPFYDMAQELGNSKCANMVALGYVLKKLPMIDKAVVEEEVKKTFAAKEKLIPLNLKALETGYNYEA